MAMPQWSSPWAPDATKDATLSALRTAYPKSTAFGGAIHPDMAWHLVRGKAGFTLPEPDCVDDLAYVRFNWARF